MQAHAEQPRPGLEASSTSSTGNATSGTGGFSSPSLLQVCQIFSLTIAVRLRGGLNWDFYFGGFGICAMMQTFLVVFNIFISPPATAQKW